MRKAFDRQRRFDSQAVLDVRLNLNCRDEIIPILKALQHIYSQPKLRDDILGAIAEDVNHSSSRKWGRQGMDYWQILVLAAVRLGCNLDYDKLQDLAEQHRALRQIMGIGDWDQEVAFDWRRIRDNVTLIRITRTAVGASTGRFFDCFGGLNPTPEPGTMLLLGVGGLGVLIRRRR